MVAVFFIISGFVLTHRSLQTIRTKQHKDLAQQVSSSALRRLVRIWTPVIIVSFLTLVLARLGLGGARQRTGVSTTDNVFHQINLWGHETMRMVNPFSDPHQIIKNPYAKTSWTLREVYWIIHRTMLTF